MRPRGLSHTALFRWGITGILLLLVLWYVILSMKGTALFLDAALPQIQYPEPRDKVLVFAPHEDDETIGPAGYLQQAVSSGAIVYVCLMTAGEGEELGAALATRRSRPRPQDFIRLGQIRERETYAALARIGIPAHHVFFLNYPNMGLDRIWSATYWSQTNPWTSPFTRTNQSPFDNSMTPHALFSGSTCLRDVEDVILKVQPKFIFTVHPSDIHRDHWPTYGFTKLALENLKAQRDDPWLESCLLYTYLVHRRGWPVPWGYYPDLPLTPPQDLRSLAVNSWFVDHLTTDQVAVKNRMILTYRSQMAAFDLLLRAFARRTEVFATIADIVLEERDLAELAVFEEPAGESRYLREHPWADITRVAAHSDGENLDVRVETASPLGKRATVLLLLHMVNPSPGTTDTLLLQYTPDQPLDAFSSYGNHGPLRVPRLTNRMRMQGDTIRFILPYEYIGNGKPVLIDALTQVGNRYADHSLTRLVTPSPAHRDLRGNSDNVRNVLE